MAEERECWRAGDLLIDVGRQRVERDGEPIELAPLSFRFLLELVRAAPNVLTLDHLMDRVWPGLVVSPDTVSQRVKLLREALGDSAKEPRYIKGLRSRGYVLAVDTVRAEADVQPPLPPAQPAQPATAAVAMPATPAIEPRAQRRGSWLAAAALVAIMAALLAWLGGREPGAGGPAVRLAVLPFESAVPADDYLASGLTNELIGTLVKTPALRVVMVGSPGALRDDLTPADMGRRLNATHLLKGSVRTIDGSLQVSAQIIRASDAAVIWAASFNREIGALLTLRDELAGAALRPLKLALPAAARSRIPSEAHRLFLHADFLTQRTSKEGFAEAQRLYDQALAIAPDFAAAWEGKARIWQFQAALGWVPLKEGYSRARELAAESLTADETFALAHTRLGAIDLLQGDLAGAARHIQRGYELEPNDQLTLGNAAIVLRSLGRLDESAAFSNVADDINPLNPRGNLAAGILELARGNNAEAARHFRATLSLSPGFQSASFYLAVALLRSGDAVAARAAIGQETSIHHRLRGLVLVEHSAGNDTAADAALADLQQRFDAGEGTAYGLAIAYAGRGKAADSFAWLDRASGETYDYELTDVVVDPLLATLHSDARWPRFLARIRRSPAELATIPFRPGPLVAAGQRS